MKPPVYYILLCLLVVLLPTASWAAADRTPRSDKNKSSTSDKSAPTGPVEEDAPGATWGKMTDAERALAITELKTFAQDTSKKLQRPLVVHETKYFLFASDLPQAEAIAWANLLDRMYNQLSTMFGV